MKSQDGRVSNRAVANLLKMELMNQRDEHHSQDLLMSQQAQLHLHRHDTGDGAVVILPDNGRSAPGEVAIGKLPIDESRKRLVAIAARLTARPESMKVPPAENGGSRPGDDATNPVGDFASLAQ